MIPTRKDVKASPTKFYQEDIIQRVGSPKSYGVVMRCWHDADDYLPPPGPQLDPLMRQLQQGEVGVSFFPNGVRDILPESNFVLVDRSFQPGDLCKRSIDDVHSGVVTSVEVKARLAHAISDEPVEGWKSVDQFERSTMAEVGDYVLCDDWVGQVIELFDESIIQLAAGQLVRLPELSSRLSVGDKGSDILPSAMGVSSMFSFIMGTNVPGNVDTVVHVEHTVLAVCWLAINQTLNPTEAQVRRRPQRLWYKEDLSKLTLIKTRLDRDIRVGDKVFLKDAADAPVTVHGQEGDPAGTVTINALTVQETHTTVNVLWQDGMQETLRSTTLIPHMNPDEYDCWPGDHVLCRNEDHQRAAVVQYVNASERIASIRYSDTSTELASVLELDPHGTSDLSVEVPQSSLGVRRGDFVFIHPDGATNGLEKPRVPKIGEVEPWVREIPVTAEGHLAGWRREMAEIGAEIATNRGPGRGTEGKIRRPLKQDSWLIWCGEVTGLRLDGTAEVTHPNSTISVYPLERLTKLYDGIEQLEDDGWAGDTSDDDESVDENGDGIWLKDGEGVWRYRLDDADGNEWQETDKDEDGPDDGDEDDAMDLEDDAMDVDDDFGTDFMTVSSHPDTPPPPLDPISTVAPFSAVQKIFNDAEGPVSNSNMDQESNTAGARADLSPWKRFDILGSAPHDHAFYATAPSQPSKNFLGRLTKEYRVLLSSLPESIIVRAYEDRTDLLRSVIIGPDNTPYQDAPFVIDWMLDSNFPHSPPMAHFLSWTNGNGRVNPNLYEEGKVCLSILNTWSGEKSESWSAARSSLLQALVSIQGLVLVKEPWFCEPAYEKLRGTEEGIINSRLYNEKAYCLSRGFVRRALEIPLGGLESDITWWYYTNRRLEKVILDSRALIAKSKLPPGDDDGELAVPRLTGGGIITLERTLSKLQDLLDSHQ